MSDPAGAIIVMLTGDQQEQLREQSLYAVPFPADTPAGSLSAAVARLLDIFPLSFEAGTDDLLTRAATAYEVRLMVMGSDGRITRYGAEDRPTVRLAVVGERDAARFLALRSGPVVVLPELSADEPVVGLPGVAYPGPSRPSTDPAHPVYRGEFEVEWVDGAYWVRIYCAVADPLRITATSGKVGLGTSRYKDINQDSGTGAVTLSAGSAEGMFWSSGGRPQRAIQWLRKYEANYPDLQPMLRSFLVPLQSYLDATAALAPESQSKDLPDLPINVDQHGEPNQLGLRGEQFEALAAVARPHSLVTYVTSVTTVKLDDVAGAVRPVSDLYGRLGIDAFRSDSLGKAYDPWFTWTYESAKDTWTVSFQNNAETLHRIARELREYYVTWEQSLQPAEDRKPSALLDSDVEGWPGKRPDELPDMSYPARKRRLNAFLNRVGPPSKTVQFILDKVVGAGAPAAKDVLDRVTDVPVVDIAAVRLALTTVVLPDAAYAVVRELISRVKAEYQAPASAAVFLTVLNNTWRSSKTARKDFNTFVGQHAIAAFANGVLGHERLAGLPEAMRNALADTIKTEGGAAIVGQCTTLATAPPTPWRTTKRDKWLAGLRDEAPGRIAADTVLLGALDVALGAHKDTPVDLAAVRRIIEQKLVPEVQEASAARFRECDFVGASPDGIHKAVLADLLPGLQGAFTAALSGSPLLAFLPEGFRVGMAKMIAVEAAGLGTTALKTLAPTSVTADQVRAFMANVPAVASQAAIGALVAADYDRLKLDADLRTVNPTDLTAQAPFPNDFASWHADRGERERQQREVGKRLTAALAGAGTEQAVARATIEELLAALPELVRKLDEECAPSERLTFYDHAQLVLGQYLKLARGVPESDRFVPVDTVAKAILFHDIEKARSKDAFGKEKSVHDREPEHRLAVAMMRRYAGLWPSYRGFLAARALVDSDPIGLYLRGTHDADTAFSYLVEWAYRLRIARDAGPASETVPTRTLWELDREGAEQALSTVGRRPPADLRTLKLDGFPVDAQRFFAEFHQYYQADFSSYTPTAAYIPRAGGSVRYAPNKDFAKAFSWTAGAVADGGELARDGRRFRYSATYEDLYTKLAAMFASADAIRDHYLRIRTAEAERIVRELADK
jgi:hypothetical protein